MLVLRGLAAGMTRAEMAALLDRTENTAKTHTLSLYRRLGARNAAHAVAIGYQLGLFQTGRGGGES